MIRQLVKSDLVLVVVFVTKGSREMDKGVCVSLPHIGRIVMSIIWMGCGLTGCIRYIPQAGRKPAFRCIAT